MQPPSRQHPENQNENQAGHSPERAVEGQTAKIKMKIERERHAAATQDDNQFAIWRWRNNFANWTCGRKALTSPRAIEPCDGCTPGDCNTKKMVR